MRIFLGLVVGFVALACIGDLKYSVYTTFYKMENKLEMSELKQFIVSDYSFNYDVYEGLFGYDPFGYISQGTEFTISNDQEGYVEQSTGPKLTLEVGLDKDIEPGLYTVKTEGKDDMTFNLLINDSFSPRNSGEYYNIELTYGDRIESTYYEDTEDFTTHFIPQTEYVEYQTGYNGIFVYGLSNFEPKIEVGKDEYDKIDYYYYSQKEEILKVIHLYDQDAILNGVPGSYFIIDHDNETN